MSQQQQPDTINQQAYQQTTCALAGDAAQKANAKAACKWCSEPGVVP